MKSGFLLAVLAVSLQAQNRTLTFDGCCSGSGPNPDSPNPITGQGLSLQFADNDSFFVTNPTASPFSDFSVTAVSNGTPSLGVPQDPGNNLTITFPNGTFSMVSIDFSKLITTDVVLADQGVSFTNAHTVNLVGALAGGGTVTASVRLSAAYQTFNFPASWQNLSSLTITAAHDTLSGPNLALLYSIDNVRFTPPPCSYSFGSAQSVSGALFGAAGETRSLTVVTFFGCPWSVSGMPDWITTSSGSGTGSGSVSYTVAANTGPPRTGTINVGGSTFTVEQNGTISGGRIIGYFPHIAARDVWTTSFTLVNKGTSPAQELLSTRNQAGGALNLFFSFPQVTPPAAPTFGSLLVRTLPANASVVVNTAGPQTPPVQVGSARLLAAGEVDGFAIFRLIPGSQEAVVPLETRDAGSYVLAFDNTGGVVLGVAATNAASSAASITVIIRDDTGAVISPPNTTLSLAANGHTSFVLSQQFPITANKRGTVEFIRPTGGRISVLGIRTTPANNTLTLTTVPALAEVGTNGGSIAHIATGGGWQTTFVLVNTGTAAAQAALKFFATGTGAPLSIPLSFPQSGGGSSAVANVVTRTLEAGATLVVQSAAPANQPVAIGSAQLTTNGNVGGFVIFRYNPNGQEAVVPLESRTANSYLIAFDNTAGTATGIALNTVSAQPVDVPVVVRDDTGAQIATDTLTLAANGHVSFTLGVDKFPVTAGKRGTIEFVSGQVGALGIRIPPTLTFTTLPALAK